MGSPGDARVRQRLHDAHAGLSAGRGRRSPGGQRVAARPWTIAKERGLRRTYFLPSTYIPVLVCLSTRSLGMSVIFFQPFFVAVRAPTYMSVGRSSFTKMALSAGRSFTTLLSFALVFAIRVTSLRGTADGSGAPVLKGVGCAGRATLPS